jgi:DMSO/TMAO reductase YedYZ molybdopterin-dependent catalytic subunit
MTADAGRGRSGRAALAGAVAAAVGVAVGEVVGAFGTPAQSLVGSVGNVVIDRADGGIVRFGIDVFGTADKAALVIGTLVVLLLVGALLGRLSWRRPWVAPVGFAAVGVVGVLATAQDPLASTSLAVLAAVVGTAAASGTLWWLRGVDRTGTALPVATTATTAGAAAPSPAPVEVPGTARGPRRAFLGWTAAAGAFAATAALAARSLSDRGAVDVARKAVALPAPASPAPATAGVGLDAEVPGITPYIVPNDDFYRIDTALIVPQVEPEGWKLSITGMVDEPYELTFDELVAMADTEQAVTLSCVSNPVGGDLVGNAVWQGVPLARILDRAGVQDGATQLVGRSVDGFTAGFPTEAAFDGRPALVAVGMNGEPLPVVHGFPARLVVSGLYGYVSATKWLSEIELTTWEAFDGYWIPRGWAKEGPVKVQSRIDVPRVGTTLPAGPTPVAGVAWAPGAGIARVEVQVDDGAWQAAELGDSLSDDTWCQWRYEWDATPGEHRIRVRATDGAGVTQGEAPVPVAPDGAEGWHLRRVQVG